MPNQERLWMAPSAADTLWIFLHIPKTAGSSFRNTLAERLQPDHNININGLRGAKKRDVAFKEAVDDFLVLDRQSHFAFASGHLKMPEALRIRESVGRPVKLLTMLRNPVLRVISEYRYQRTAAHPQHEQFSATFPTLEAFIESRGSQNKMFRHVALAGETIEDAITRIEKDFSLVGVVEMYPQSMRLCSEAIGMPFTARSRLNVTQNSGHNKVRMNSALANRIMSLNGKDERLWVYFRDRLSGMTQGPAS